MSFDLFNLYFRIASSQAGLETGNFFVWGLPPPTQAIYNDHSGRRPQGGGGEGRHGYNNAQLGWIGENRLSAQQASVLRDIIETAETTGGQGNGTIYLTLPKTTAEASGVIWVDISGIAIMPNWIPEQWIHGIAYQDVVLRLNDCTVEAEPSTVVS